MQEHFGDRLLISSGKSKGNSNVLTLIETASSILQDFKGKSGEDANEEQRKKDIIIAAAKIIRNETKQIEVNR